MKNLLSIIKTSAIILILSGFCRTGEGYCQPQLLPNWPVELGVEHPRWATAFKGGVNWAQSLEGLSNYYLCAFGFQIDPSHGIYLWDQYADSIAGWPVHDIWQILYSPAAGDIDNDGEWEIVVSSRWWPIKTYVYAYELDGSLIEGWPVIIEQEAHAWDGMSCPILYDLDGDNTLEIILMGNQTNWMYVWNYDGTNFSEWPIFLDEDEEFWGICPAVGDVDLDGHPEIAVFYGNPLYEMDHIGRACLFNSDGSVKEGWPVMLEDAGYNMALHPTIADIDGDLYPDIIMATPQYPLSGYGSYIYAFENTGAIKNGWPVYESLEIYASPVTADIDMDGLPEIVVPILQQPDIFLSAYEYNGEYVDGWNGTTRESSIAYADPIITDIEGDDKPEILCTSNSLGNDSIGYIFALDNMGNLLEWSPLRVIGLTFTSAPAVFDIYPSGEKVLAVPTEYIIYDSLYNPLGYHHFSYMYGLGPDEDFARPEWPRFAHDPQNTCNYHHPLQTSVRDDDDELLPRNLRLYNYPNPFNARTNIIIDLPRDDDVKVEVFNIYGQRIEKLIDERLEAGSHKLPWDAIGYASGVYFYKLTTGKVILSRKMVMVK